MIFDLRSFGEGRPTYTSSYPCFIIIIIINLSIEKHHKSNNIVDIF